MPPCYKVRHVVSDPRNWMARSPELLRLRRRFGPCCAWAHRLHASKGAATRARGSGGHWEPPPTIAPPRPALKLDTDPMRRFIRLAALTPRQSVVGTPPLRREGALGAATAIRSSQARSGQIRPDQIRGTVSSLPRAAPTTRVIRVSHGGPAPRNVKIREVPRALSERKCLSRVAAVSTAVAWCSCGRCDLLVAVVVSAAPEQDGRSST